MCGCFRVWFDIFPADWRYSDGLMASTSNRSHFCFDFVDDLSPLFQSSFTMSNTCLLLLLLLLCASSSIALKVKEPPQPQQQQEQEQQEQQQEQEEEKEKCRWGEPCNSNHSTDSIDNTSTGLPFVTKTQHAPPEGFLVDARVFTDPNDKLAHFDITKLQLPYFDCASTGITTSPLKLQYAYFRHTFSASPRFEGSEFDNHAVILVTLHQSIIIELNSGESQTFLPGSVILLEDVVAGGHKCKSPDGHDVTVLLLTLPHHYSANKDLVKSSCLVMRPALKLRRGILTGFSEQLTAVIDWGVTRGSRRDSSDAIWRILWALWPLWHPCEQIRKFRK